MKGYIPVDIPVKPYIKAYIHKQLGTVLQLAPGSHLIYREIYSLLERHQNPDRKDALCKYSAKIRLFVPVHVHLRRGCNLNATNIRSFNAFVEDLIKERFHHMMDDLVALHPTFEGNLPFVRRRLGIDLEAWSDDSMKKDYYRYRQRKKLPLFYTSFAVNVPSDKAVDAAF